MHQDKETTIMSKPTKEEKQELIEILKFTPCTYKIEIWGYGGEIAMGRVDPKTVEFFKTNLISVPNYATSWADEGDDDYVAIPDELKPFPQGSWYDGDNIEHTSGAEFGGCTVRVSDENDNEVWEKDLSTGLEDEGCKVDYSGDYDVDEYVTEDTAVFVGQSFEKGTFFSGDLELKAPFDPKKLKFTYTTVAGWDILTSVEYDGEELDGSGGYDSTGKSTEYKFYYLGDGEIEEYVEPSDEDYGVPAFGPSPSDWEKSPKFKFKKQKPTGVGWYNVNWGHGTTYGSLYWNGTNFVEFNYGKETIISDDSIVTWQGYNWDTSDWSNRPPEPPDVICNNKKCKQTGYSDKMERNDDYDLICPHCGKTDFDWIDYDPETATGRKNRDKYCIPPMPSIAEYHPNVLKQALDELAEEYGTPTYDEIDALEQVECVQCDWKGSVEETFDKDGEMVCPECGEPVEFVNVDEMDIEDALEELKQEFEQLMVQEEEQQHLEQQFDEIIAKKKKVRGKHD